MVRIWAVERERNNRKAQKQSAAFRIRPKIIDLSPAMRLLFLHIYMLISSTWNWKGSAPVVCRHKSANDYTIIIINGCFLCKHWLGLRVYIHNIIIITAAHIPFVAAQATSVFCSLQLIQWNWRSREISVHCISYQLAIAVIVVAGRRTLAPKNRI